MSVANIICPFCAKQAFKFPMEEIMMFLCHYCQRTMSWEMASKFGKTKVSTEQKTTEVDYSAIINRLTPINKLPSEHEAVQFINGRKIPNDDLYYTEDLNKFLQGTKYENKFKSKSYIIIPLRSKYGLFGVQARRLDNEGPKYTTIKFVDCATIFGRNKIDNTKPIIVVEGPFDSMFVENSIAVTGSGITKIDFSGDFVYCLDNEPRSKQIVSIMKKLMKEDYKVVIWPDNIKQKDINDMVLAGIDVNTVIRENIFSGPKALVKLSEWKKV